MSIKMTTNGNNSSTNVSLRDRQKAETREAIVDAALEALAANEFDRATHEGLAERVGVARRTVYRYFPDREALLNAMWTRVIRDPALAAYSLPTDEGSLTSTLADFFAKMDENALAMTVAMTTPRGRELRATVRDVRGKAWRKACAERVSALPEGERDLPLAVLQLLRSGFAWLEMRDQWRLNGEQIAIAVGWATRVLTADLRDRAGRPLGDGPASRLRGDAVDHPPE